MSVLNQSGEEQVECPLCMEPLEVDDLHFYPCTCGYQICRFCWNRIREGENGRCPACRKAYPENPADFTPLSQEQVAAIKIEKRAREQKRRNKTLESRRALANVRVVQKNLVFVVGLPVRLADPEILKRQEYFGKYGKIQKVVINQSTTYAGSQGPSASAYVTYLSSADALRAIQGVNNVALDGRALKCSLGTTKYCANFMKNQLCPKPDCMYLHELGDPDASFTKEEMHAGLHQAYERRLHDQLLAATKRELAREAAAAPPDSQTGHSSTNGEHSSKDGHQSKFIPTSVVTSSHINIVNSSNSKKDSSANESGGSGNSSSNSSNSNSVIGSKEAWPSLGSSPPLDTPRRKQPSPSQNSVKSQENGPTDTIQTQQSQRKNSKDNEISKSNSSRHNKDSNSTNSRKSKTDNKNRQRHSNGVSNTLGQAETEKATVVPVQQNSVFESDPHHNYLSNELDELESDRHSLLENHDLLDNSDHCLLEDDNKHDLLDEPNTDVMMMQRHREMLAGLVDNSHLIQHSKPPAPINGFSSLDTRDAMYLGNLDNDRQISQMYLSLAAEKELMMRERSRSEMIMQQNEMMARQQMMDKHYMPSNSIAMDSAGDLLGANYHSNASMLASFGVRASMGGAGSAYGLHAQHQHMLQQQQQQQQQPTLMNGYDVPQPQQSEGRYLAENMDKFFTDFHKTQQMRLLMTRGGGGAVSMGGVGGASAGPAPHEMLDRRYERPRGMMSAERLELDHKQRVGVGARLTEASGDADDDLDFDPFQETQKALAEMIESEMMHTAVSGGDNNERSRRSRLPPPGFSHMNAFGIGVPRTAPAPQLAPAHHQGYSTTSAMYSDWTQMDPAIVSTSNHTNFAKSAAVATPPAVHAMPPHGALSQQQQEVFARFNQLGVSAPNGLAKPPNHLLNAQQWAGQKMGWAVPSYTAIPLPPGFAPAKSSARPAECVDAN